MEHDNKKNEILELIKNKFYEDDSKNKDIFMQNIINSVTCAENCENKNYIEFLSNLVNKLLDTLINTGNTIESPEDNIENKNKFTPDNTFFELYQQLNKTNTSENNNTINESIMKIYELVMKNISDSNYQNKLFLSLLQLLNLQISKNEEIKSDIIIKSQEEGTKSLYNFLLENAMPEIYKKNESKEKRNSKDLNLNKKKSLNEKFILIENINEEEDKDEKPIIIYMAQIIIIKVQKHLLLQKNLDTLV